MLNHMATPCTKCSIPYLRTYRSTICKLKDTVAKQHSGLKRAVHDVEEAVGGLAFCNSKGALARGERQASYFKSTSNESKGSYEPTHSWSCHEMT